MIKNKKASKAIRFAVAVARFYGITLTFFGFFLWFVHITVRSVWKDVVRRVYWYLMSQKEEKDDKDSLVPGLPLYFPNLFNFFPR